MQQATVGSDTSQIQQLYRTLFLRTEFILSNYMDEYCDFLMELEIKDDYLNAVSQIDLELKEFGVSDKEINDFINSMATI
ncbi:MAG TPA: hypothetical protein VEY70_14105 [Metabacillus sp.]|nr:hypothetical protein [Metabacillus sp.]